MKQWGLVGCLLCVGLVGCAKDENVFVLVPDNEGQVGTIVVSNPQGSQTLSGASESVTVASASEAPSEVEVIDEATKQEIFADVLTIEPPAPAKFLFHFKLGSAVLQPASVPVIDDATNAIKQRGSRDISVNGHTDRSGDEAYNMRLSIRRAEKIRDMLVERGVSGEYISVDSHGEGNPVVPTEDGVAEPQNRRVEIVVR